MLIIYVWLIMNVSLLIRGQSASNNSSIIIVHFVVNREEALLRRAIQSCRCFKILNKLIQRISRVCKSTPTYATLTKILTIHLMILHNYKWLKKMSDIFNIKDICLRLRIKNSKSLMNILPYKILISHWILKLTNKDSISLTTFISIFSKSCYMFFYLYLFSEVSWEPSNSKMCLD